MQAKECFQGLLRFVYLQFEEEMYLRVHPSVFLASPGSPTPSISLLTILAISSYSNKRPTGLSDSPIVNLVPHADSMKLPAEVVQDLAITQRHTEPT